MMKYLFALLLTLVSLGTVRADSRDTTITTIPFDFVIGNKTFPAGKYTISRISDDPRTGLHIQSADGKTNMLFRPITLESSSNDQAKLEFLHQGDLYFLARIIAASDTYTLSPKYHRQLAAKPAAKPDET